MPKAKQNNNSRYGERFEDEDMEQMMKDADLDRLLVLSFLIFLSLKMHQSQVELKKYLRRWTTSSTKI